jgi:signal recognition particle receptor subunit beta
LAILDVERNAVVIRIVYDGPPEAGKTTSLRALSGSLARPMTSPAQAGERTLFFDWLEYTGGLFEGRQIRCQVVSVPGQAELAHRRRALLEAADVVVFVSDSTPTAVESTRAALAEMQAMLAAVSGPPVGFIVQANKRDLPEAVELATLRATLADDGVAVLESVASEGRGVREAFVFAVRLALDRVRELLRDHALAVGPPAVESSAELLRELQQLESEVASTVAAPAPAIADGGVLPPDHEVPSGMIWPPVEGRVLLLDACATPFTPRQLPQGDWTGEAGPWRFHSPRQASYADPELGRRALVEWARVHASGQRWLSAPRVVVLAASGSGTWRLWQIVRAETTLRDHLRDSNHSAHALLRRLLDAGRALLAATESLVLAPYRLPITVDTVGIPNGTPLYVGLLPDPFLARSGHPISADDRPTLLRRELGALAAAELRHHAGAEFPPLGLIARDTDAPAVIEAVRDVLADAGLG